LSDDRASKRMKQLYLRITFGISIALMILFSIMGYIFSSQKNQHEKIFEEYAIALGLKEIQHRLNNVPIHELRDALKIEQRYINAKLEIKKQEEIKDDLEWDPKRRFKCECKPRPQQKHHVFRKTYYFPLYEQQIHFRNQYFLHVIPNVNPILPPKPPTTDLILWASISILSIFLITFSLLYPWRQRILKMNDAVNRFEKGDLSARIDDSHRDILGLLGKSFNQMASQLQNEIKSREDLIQATAHELGHPLSRMKLNLAFIEMHCPNGLEKEFQQNQKRIRSVEEDMDLLEDLMQELVYFLEAGNRRVECKFFAFNYVQQIAESLAEEHQSPIRYQNEIKDPLLYDQIYADPKLFSRVLENLLRNAIVYSKSQIVVCTKLVEEPKLNNLTNNQTLGDFVTLKIEIRDDGCGIPEEDRQRVLEPFVRLDPSRDRKLGGFGLGLAIVSKIMLQHGSLLEITTAPEGGAQLNTYWRLTRKKKENTIS
jgi:signal transduction histidine kinase